jgi:hypothetical protein
MYVQSTKLLNVISSVSVKLCSFHITKRLLRDSLTINFYFFNAGGGGGVPVNQASAVSTVNLIGGAGLS